MDRSYQQAEHRIAVDVTNKYKVCGGLGGVPAPCQQAALPCQGALGVRSKGWGRVGSGTPVRSKRVLHCLFSSPQLHLHFEARAIPPESCAGRLPQGNSTINCCLCHERHGPRRVWQCKSKKGRSRTCTVHSMRIVPQSMGIALVETSPSAKPTPQAAAGAADQLPTVAGTALAVKAVLKATYPAAVFATAANYADQVRGLRVRD